MSLVGLAFLFLVFGLGLIISSIIIKKSKDPRKLLLFNWRGIHPLYELSLEEAKIKANESAKVLFIVGFVLIIICIIVLLLANIFTLYL